MSKEFDLLGLAAAGGWLKWRRKHADIPPGTPCGNCETPLEGTYCHSCGQLAEDFHKNIWHLFSEVLESFFHWDGRLWRTLPALLYKPGELTRNFINGKRAYQAPPFRLFLVVLVLVFLAGHYGSPALNGPPIVTDRAEGVEQARREIREDASMSASEKKAALAVIDRDWGTFGRAVGETAGQAGDAAVNREAAVDPATGKARTATRSDLNVNLGGPADSELNRWFEARAKAVQDDPERFFLILETWAHRVAVLALPVSALILSLLFVFQRRFFVYDHLIFSMHSLSFQLILLAVIMGLQLLVGPSAWWLLLFSPMHLFIHMRGTYSSGVFSTLLRMFILFILTTIAFTLLAILWLYLGFAEMGTS